MKNFSQPYFSLLFGALIVFASMVNAQKKPLAFVPSSANIKQISSDVFLKAGHRIGSNPPQLYLFLKRDSSIDYEHYRLKTGPAKYLQVVNENGAMRPRKIMVTSPKTAESKKLRGIGITFSTRQEIDDFVAELNISASVPSRSGNTASSENTSKITSEAFKKEGHRIHADKILDIQINRELKLDVGILKNIKKKNGFGWLEITHKGQPLAPKRISGYGRDDTNILRNIMIDFPNRQELDSFVKKLDLKLKFIKLRTKPSNN